MAYEKVNWKDYDDELTFQQNMDNHAVATDALLNHMDNGIYKANNFSVGTVESSDEPNVSIIDTGEGYTFDFEIPRGEQGEPGIDGLQGIQGEKGDPGADGRAATIRVGNVTEGEEASVINVGTDTDAIFDFVIPVGGNGTTIPGRGATVTIGSVTTGEPGTDASVANSGTETDAILDFIIPRGDKGEQGDPGKDGSDGINGHDGYAATIKIGEVTTLEAGEQATVINIGTENAAILNFGIPRGENGKDGESSGSVAQALSRDQINALNEMFKICTFVQDPNPQYSSFCKAFGIEEVSPDDQYMIQNNLTNVSTDNQLYYITKQEPYKATLNANAGYVLDSVIVEMNGIDITESVYENGVINIPSVTGNVIITAIAITNSSPIQPIQNGLIGYFDLRNKSFIAGSGGLYYINSDVGNGMVYSWSNQSNKVADDYGIKGFGAYYTMQKSTGYPVVDEIPSNRTICLMGYGNVFIPASIGTDGTISDSFLYRIKYKNNNGEVVSLANEQLPYPDGFTKTGYNVCIVVINESLLKIYFNSILCKTLNGSEISDFVTWDIGALNIGCATGGTGTAVIIYDRELSNVEIVETVEFLKTLEANQ